MKIVSWNVNGLRSVMSKTFAEFLESVSPDVLCLQETKVSREVADSLEIPFKYKIFSCGVFGNRDIFRYRARFNAGRRARRSPRRGAHNRRGV